MTAMAPRIPLVLLPAGLAMFSLFGMIAIQEQRRPSETVFFLSDLPFVPELGALAVVAFVLSVLTVSRPAWFPILDISDHTAAPLATTVVFMSIVSTAVVYLGASLDPSFAVGLGAVTVLVFGPWLGSRVLLGPKSATEWDRLTTGVRNAGLVTVVSLGGSWFIYDAYGGTFPESLGFLAAILVAIIGVGVTSLVLFVFLLPFHYRSRGR
jgi:hypothetical protein